jgi:vanillate O-demethylase monooxygenase subunit
MLEKPVVLFRTESGRPVALEDRCPHRFAPLSLGRVVGERIRCGYHGAEFDPTGACAHVPGQDLVPPKARIVSYPLIEKHGYVWIWLGDPAGAGDTSTIPEFLYRSGDPGWDGGYGHFESIQANYNLINDNLFDITHAEYVHPESFGGEEMRMYRRSKPGSDYVDGEMTWTATDRGIVFRMRSLNMATGGPFYRWMVASSMGRDSYPDPVDLDMEVSWGAPSYTSFLLNARPAGKPREGGVEVCNMHAITPESPASSHYFYRSVKNYGDAELAKVFVSGVRAIFDQDKPLLEAQQRRVGERDLFAQQPVSFAGDLLQQKARGINRRLLDQEQANAAVPDSDAVVPGSARRSS